MKNSNTSPKEAVIHQQVVYYLKARYPHVVFRTDFAAGLKLSMFQAKKHKLLQSGRSFPDLFIAEPSGKFHGLFLELKRDRKQVYKLNGELVSNKRIREQAEVLADLNKKGYCALFACGFIEARNMIDAYLLHQD